MQDTVERTGIKDMEADHLHNPAVCERDYSYIKCDRAGHARRNRGREDMTEGKQAEKYSIDIFVPLVLGVAITRRTLCHIEGHPREDIMEASVSRQR
jgi:hypothetical protein